MADQLDPELMYKLNEKFTELANSINNVNTAIGVATNRVNRASNNAQERAQRRNLDAIEESSKAVKNQSNAVNSTQSTFNRLNQQLDNQYRAYQANQQAMADIDAAAAKAHREQNNRLSASSVGLDILTTAAMGAKRVFDAMIDAQIAYTKALISGERGLALEAKQQETVGKAVNQVIRDFGNLSMTIGGLMVVMGPLGMIGRIAGAAAVGLGLFAQYEAKARDAQLEIATMLAQLKDKLFDTFKDLSNSALTSAGGMTTLREQMKKLSFAMSEAGQFAGIIKGAGKELAQIGPTTIKGLEKFIETSADLYESQLGKELQYMGLDREEQMKGTLKFLSLQARLGMQQEKDIKKLSQAAGKYISELDQLAALTGTTRQEQEQAREQIMAIEELRAALIEETAKGDAADKDRLKVLQDGIQVATLLSAEGMKDAGASLARTLAAGGVTRAEDAKLLQTAPQFLQNMMQGVGSVTDNLQLFGRETKQTLTQLSSAVKVSGDIGKEIAAVDYAKFFDFIPKLDKIADLQKQFPDKTLPQIIDEMRKVSDPATKAVTDLINQQRKEAIAKEEAGGGIKSATDLFNNAAKGFGANVSDFGKYVRQLLGIKDPTKVEKTEATKKAEAKVEEKKKITDIATEKATAASIAEDQAKKQLAALYRAGDIAGVEAKKVELQKLTDDRIKAEQELMNASRDQSKAAFDASEQRKKDTREVNQLDDKIKFYKDSIIVNNMKIDSFSKDQVELQLELKKSTGFAKVENENRLKHLTRLRELAEQEVKEAEENIKKTEERKKQLEKKTETATPVATTQDRKEFVDKMYNTLLEQAKKQGVANPEVIARLGVAQSALETGYGKSTSGGQNFFGIKAGKGQPSVMAETEEFDVAKGVMVKQQAAFKKYSSMEESAADYIKFLKENQRYKEVLQAKTIDDAILAQSLTGYATDPRYGQKLATINQGLGTEPGKMFDGGVVTEPLTTRLRDGGQDEAVIPLNKLAELIPIKSLVDAIERQTAMLTKGFESMTDKLAENNSMVSDQLLYMQN
jgi:flagellum-specific peptidoglycan hydrolase FlgJ